MEVYQFTRFVLFYYYFDAKMRPVKRLHMLHTLHTRIYLGLPQWLFAAVVNNLFCREREHNRLEFLYPNHFYPGIRVSTIEEPLSERLDSVIVVLDVCMMCFGQLVTRGTNRVIFEQEYYLDIHILR